MAAHAHAFGRLRAGQCGGILHMPRATPHTLYLDDRGAAWCSDCDRVIGAAGSSAYDLMGDQMQHWVDHRVGPPPPWREPHAVFMARVQADHRVGDAVLRTAECGAVICKRNAVAAWEGMAVCQEHDRALRRMRANWRAT